MSEFEVNTDVVSAIVTLLSDEADTDNETVEPADTVPMLPAPVEKLGAVEADKIAEDDLTALPSLFSTLKKYEAEARVKVALIDVELVNATAVALVIAPVDELIASTIGTETKLVPAIVICEDVLGATYKLVEVIVGLVSDIDAKDKLPDASVTIACPDDPSDVGSLKATPLELNLLEIIFKWFPIFA